MKVGQKSRGVEGHVWMASVNECQRVGSEQATDFDEGQEGGSEWMESVMEEQEGGSEWDECE
jgi:hypothetical protein